MEFNRSSKEKFHQTGQSSDDVHSQGSGHVRSYTCTFCKRGFSNAQALGGHMNIHRKDRAKLKEFPEGNQTQNLDDSSSQVESSEEKSGSPKRPWVFSKDDDHEVSRGGQEGGAGEVKQLCLFVDKHQSPSKNGAEEKSKELSTQGSSRDQELDLELRLGLEHHER